MARKSSSGLPWDGLRQGRGLKEDDGNWHEEDHWKKERERFVGPDRQYWKAFVTALCATLACATSTRRRLCIPCVQRATITKRVTCERRRVLNSAYFLFQKKRKSTHYSQPLRSLSCKHTYLRGPYIENKETVKLISAEEWKTARLV